MKKIKLPRGTYQYDPNKQLGREGGFGIVYLGSDKSGNEVAVKKIKIEAEEASHRELTIVDELAGKNFEHILEVYDSGQDAESESYYIVMPKAEKSLQDYIDEKGTLTDNESIEILLQIILGLLEIPDIVHRDLKPDNVLLHDGKWKVSDFGIARFVEKATSKNTLKECLTPAYAAPEQCKLERSTNFTDIYALGCVGYTLLIGKPPFSGPTLEEFCYQHINEKPPRLEITNHTLANLLSLMLRKSPGVRPSGNRIKIILEKIKDIKIDKESNSALKELSEAASKVSRREAEKEATLRQEINKRQQRENIASEAYEILDEIFQTLLDKITDVAPNAKKVNSKHLKLDRAELTIHYMTYGKVINESAFSNAGWDVVAGCLIVVIQHQPNYTWGSNLWFMRTDPSSDYRWYEVSYMDTPTMSVGHEFTPFAIENIEDADYAASNIVHTYQIAWGPRPIDHEDIEDFYNRWTKLFANALEGKLRHPRSLPLPNDYFKKNPFII